MTRSLIEYNSEWSLFCNVPATIQDFQRFVNGGNKLQKRKHFHTNKLQKN